MGSSCSRADVGEVPVVTVRGSQQNNTRESSMETDTPTEPLVAVAGSRRSSLTKPPCAASLHVVSSPLQSNAEAVTGRAPPHAVIPDNEPAATTPPPLESTAPSTAGDDAPDAAVRPPVDHNAQDIPTSHVPRSRRSSAGQASHAAQQPLDPHLLSLEQELSSFRREVASAVVDTATMLSELRAECVALRRETQDVLAWRREAQSQLRQQSLADEQLRIALSEAVQSQLHTRKDVEKISAVVDGLRKDLQHTGDLVLSCSTNADDAARAVQEMRINFVELESSIARVARDTAAVEATLRAFSRERTASESELRTLRAEFSVLQRRFESHRDATLFVDTQQQHVDTVRRY